jgi:subtilase family serine protease
MMLSLAACSSSSPTSFLPTPSGSANQARGVSSSAHANRVALDASSLLTLSASANVQAACSPSSGVEAACYALRNMSAPAGPPSGAAPLSTTTIPGYHPDLLQAAYNLLDASLWDGKGQTVAIIDAFDDPNVASDLAVYRQAFGLPSLGCTATTPCFRKVKVGNPPTNAGWGEEISLDVDMVSAICPNCNITLVEATSSSFANLALAVDTAAYLTPHPSAISNSYGAPESKEIDIMYASHYNHPGTTVTVSSGDSGYGVSFPASVPFVTAVGGTTLIQGSRGWSEVAWSGAGSGCSDAFSRPLWQKGLPWTTPGSTCANRTVADVSAVANPATGVSVYDTYCGSVTCPGWGWLVFGGTSVSSPIIASVYALAGNTSSVVYGSYPYANRSNLFAITSGNNGVCTPPSADSYLCTAFNGDSGYNGPTGLGTPNGIGAF